MAYLAAFEFGRFSKRRSSIFYGESARYFIENFKKDDDHILYVCHSRKELEKALEEIANFPDFRSEQKR